MADLDSILSGNGEAVSGDTQEQETNVTQVSEGEGESQADTGPTEGSEGQQEQRSGKMVPIQALDAEKHKVKRYTEQVADFEKSVTGLRDQNSNLTRQVSELLQRLPKQEQQQPAKPDIFENPDAAIRAGAEALITPEFAKINQTLMGQAQLIAGIKYGDDKVAEAEREFITSMNAGKLDPADYQKVVNSPNRYAAAVQWHQRQLAQAEIGPDPAAYRAKLEAELREKITAELQGGNGGGEQQQQRVMPTNLVGARNVGSRSGPAWSGPASLQDIFARK